MEAAGHISTGVPLRRLVGPNLGPKASSTLPSRLMRIHPHDKEPIDRINSTLTMPNTSYRSSYRFPNPTYNSSYQTADVNRPLCPPGLISLRTLQSASATNDSSVFALSSPWWLPHPAERNQPHHPIPCCLCIGTSDRSVPPRGFGASRLLSDE